jgi:GNAT superfamily N-acetyltransferase
LAVHRALPSNPILKYYIHIGFHVKLFRTSGRTILDTILDKYTIGVPTYPLPAVVLGRPAVDRSRQGFGLGETLLIDTVHRIVRASAAIAVYAVVVDAKHERAEKFYQRYGFRSFATVPRRLFLPLETFERLGL